jgi:hypothetical protein
MSLSTSSVINVAGREVVVRELTVEIARLIVQPNPNPDFLGDVLFIDLRLCDLAHLTNLTAQEIEGMYPSDLNKVIEACKAKNPDFFEMLARAFPKL